MPGIADEGHDRLWQHLLHEDNLFNERLNSIITFQSVLLGLAALLISSRVSDSQHLLCALGIVGISMCLISFYVQFKQAHIVAYLTERCRRVMPEFDETFAYLDSRKWRRIPSKKLLVYFLSIVFALAWLTFFILGFGLEAAADLG